MPFEGHINEPMVQVPYSPALFSASGTLVWTVDKADYDAGGGLWISTWGRLLQLELLLNQTTLSGSGNQLILKLPGGPNLGPFVPLGIFTFTNGSGWETGKIYVTAPNVIRFYRVGENNYPGVANNCYVRVSAAFYMS